MMLSNGHPQVSSYAMCRSEDPSWCNQCSTTKNFLIKKMNDLTKLYVSSLLVLCNDVMLWTFFYYLHSIHQCNLPRPFALFRLTSPQNTQSHSRIAWSIGNASYTTCAIIFLYFVFIIWWRRDGSNCLEKHVRFLRWNLRFSKTLLIAAMPMRMPSMRSMATQWASRPTAMRRCWLRSKGFCRLRWIQTWRLVVSNLDRGNWHQNSFGSLSDGFVEEIVMETYNAKLPKKLIAFKKIMSYLKIWGQF